MSLQNPDDEYSELVPEHAGRIGKYLRKTRRYLIVLVIGILLGVFLLSYINTTFFPENKTCSDCLEMKGLLNKENACLYSLVPNPQLASEQCNKLLNPNSLATNNSNDTNQPQALPPALPPKDFNEEPA